MLRKKSILIIAVLTVFILSLPVLAFESDSFYSGQQGPRLNYSGEIFPELRLFKDGDMLGNMNMVLELSYEADYYDIEALLNCQTGARDEFEPAEYYINLYKGPYEILLGKKRLVWGKGDGVHVVDQINAEDMSDFINPDYLDRQLGEEMFKVNRYLRGGQARMEFVYTPDFTGHRLADDPESNLGNWLINPFGAFTLAQISASTGLSQTEIVHRVESAFPEYNDQYALRFTDSRQGVDYGLSYYHGYLRDPGYNRSIFLAAAGNPSLMSNFNQFLNSADFHYDQVDMLGGELATVWNTINTRFELAYFRTGDEDGDNPFVRNSKIAWVIGGDRDLPVSNLNLNLQLTGEKVLDSSEIEDNSIYDLQYDEDEDYITNRVIAKLEDSYRNETIKPSLTLVYNLGDEDYSLAGKIDYKIKDNMYLELLHKIFDGDTGTTFGQFNCNDFTSMGVRYSF